MGEPAPQPIQQMASMPNMAHMPNMASFLVNSMATNYISSLMQTSDLSNFSVKNIAKLLAILSIEEVRDQLKSLLQFLRSNLPTVYSTLQKYVIKYVLFLAKMFKRRKPQIEVFEMEEITQPSGSSFNLTWNKFSTYSKLIKEKLEHDPNCSFEKIMNNSLSTGTAGQFEFSIIYTDIVIPFAPDMYLGIDNLEMNGSTLKAKYAESNEVRLTNFMNDRQFALKVNLHVDALYKLHQAKYKQDEAALVAMNGYIPIIYNRYRSFTIEEFDREALNFSHIEIAVLWMVLIYNKTLKWNIEKLFLEIECIIYAHRMGLRSTYEDEIWQIHTIKLFNKLFSGSDIKFEWSLFDGWTFHSNSPLVVNQSQIYNTYKHLMGTEGDAIEIEITLTSPNQYTDEKLLKTFIKFLDENSDIKNKGEEISIYELKLERVITSVSTVNPEYEQWDDLIQMMKTSPSFVASDMPTPPKKTLTIEKETSKVKLTEINTVFKKFDTVYLPENTKNNLIRMLDNFQDKQDGLFQRLGIPSKLGICLYGEPGTGKSTTIQAIASYLGKDIYFVNLNGVTTNSQLKELFDHVIKKDCTGGIIVFEDIDCMTDIVKKRIDRPSVSTNLTRTLEDDTLSLSYLLNLLDGTLCAKNTIFIMTTNHIDYLDPALIRPGRVDVKIHLSHCDEHQIQIIWESVLEKQLSERELSYASDMQFTPAELIYHLIEYVYRLDVSSEEIFDDLRQKLITV